MSLADTLNDLAATAGAGALAGAAGRWAQLGAANKTIASRSETHWTTRERSLKSEGDFMANTSY